MRTEVDVTIDINDIISDIKTEVLKEELKLRDGEFPLKDKIRDSCYIDRTLSTNLYYHDVSNILNADQVSKLVKDFDLESEIIDEYCDEYYMDNIQLKRMLCRLVGVNYHTDNDTILNLLKEKI
jgi:hypothetical protein